MNRKETVKSITDAESECRSTMRIVLTAVALVSTLCSYAHADQTIEATFPAHMSEPEHVETLLEPLDIEGILKAAETRSGWIEPLPEEELPSRFSWHDFEGEDWMSPVRSQGSCGSCWTFGALAALEGHINLAMNDSGFDMDLSEQFMVACGAGSCASGGMAEEVLLDLQTEGIPDEACYPYLAEEGECADTCSDWRDRVIKIYDWYILISPTEEQLKTELLNGPMPVTMRVEGSFHSYNSESGVFVGSETPCGFFENQVNHVVALVGWDDDDDCWIAKNSWDDDWGENGYFRIKRGTSCLGSFTANWLRVDDTTIPGSGRTAAICGPVTVSQEVDVEQGETSENAVEITLTNCGNVSTPWSVLEDAREWAQWLSISPLEGTLEAGASETVSVTVLGDGKELGNYQLHLDFEPLKTGEAYGFDLTVNIMEEQPDGDMDEDGDAESETDAEAACIEEGGSIAVIPGGPSCCEGLSAIGCDSPQDDGSCPMGCEGSVFCANCGNDICGPGENNCNCPEDCTAPTDGDGETDDAITPDGDTVPDGDSFSDSDSDGIPDKDKESLGSGDGSCRSAGSPGGVLFSLWLLGCLLVCRRMRFAQGR